MNRRVKIVLALTSLIVLVTSVTLFLYVKNLPPIPNSIVGQLNFKPVVAGAQKTVTKPANIKFNPETQILSYSQYFKGVDLQVSQQSIPESYIDFPDKLKQEVKNSGLEQTIQTLKGEVFIFQKDGKPTAVTLREEVMILVQSNSLLDVKLWAEFFNLFKPI